MSEHRPAERVLAAIMGEAWAITAKGYDKIVEIASRENVITADVLQKIEQNHEAVLAKQASRMENTEGVVKRDGVAVIDVTGPIFRYADMFSRISGATSVSTLAADFTAAMADPMTMGVVLNFDSPGGQVSGINELANLIVSLRQKYPQKKVVAYVGAMAASAAYWLASATEEIVMDATAEVGSIGVVISARVPPQSSDRVEKVSSRAPRKRLSPASEAGQAEMQATADAIEEVFFSFVKDHRPAGMDTIEGGMAMGQKAIAAKLADRLGSLESLISELGRPRVAAVQTNPRKGARMSENQNTAEAPEQEPAAITESPEVLALKEQVALLLAERDAEKAAREKAENDKKAAEANAQVEAWVREGFLSGNATDKVRDVYVAASLGKPVSSAQIAEMVAALPKFDTQRVAVGATTEPKAEAPTAEDWKKFDSGDREAKARIHAYVTGLVAKDSSKNYTAHLKAARAAAMASK